MISMVLCGKNDNYGGHFDKRLFLTLKYNTKNFEKRGVDTEIVFVEWNPIKDRPLLSEELVKKFDNIHCYVVESEVHNLLAGPYNYMTFLEFFAKNVGIRRSHGEYIICTNADVFYGDLVFEKIATDSLRKNIIYRTERHDIRFNKLKNLNESGLKDAIFRVNPTFGRKPYVDASGDFTMASKELFLKINGYDENMRFVKIHKDSRILFTAMHHPEIDFELLGNMYHIDHAGSAVGSTGNLDNYRATNGPYGWKYILNLPYTNKSFWGLSSEVVDEISIGEKITKLRFKEDFNIDDYQFRDDEYLVKPGEVLTEYVKMFNKFQIEKLGARPWQETSSEWKI